MSHQKIKKSKKLSAICPKKLIINKINSDEFSEELDEDVKRHLKL